jgi:hypothetical protein
MTGGYIGEQQAGDHQVVIFTFSGKITTGQASEWNKFVQEFKNKVFTPVELTGVTIRGERTPPKFRPKKSRRK